MKLSIIAMAIVLSGCANTEYVQYAKSQEAASVARSNALATIAQSGDTAAVAAVMALALGAGQSQLQAPPQNQALSWAQVLVPGLTSIAGMRYQYLSTVAQSNNSAAVAQSTNNTFGSIAGLIQAPGAITTTTDRHDVISPAPVVITPTVINPPVVVPDTVVITPVVPQ